jgi:hypothetical protein
LTGDDEDVGSFELETMERQAREAAAPVIVDPWHERRRHSFGASEVPALLVALGLASDAEAAALPKYMREAAGRIIRRKAFPTRERSGGSAASRGQRAELPCLVAWAASDDAVARELVSAHHADEAPRSWYPLVDRHCPRLSATPDGWGVDVYGDTIGLEVKTTMEPLGGRLPWWYATQVHAQNAVADYARSAIVIGEGWAHWDEGRRLPPHAVIVERDEERIERIRAAVRTGWARVEAMRAERKQKDGQ